jgi:hypothetical protein
MGIAIDGVATPLLLWGYLGVLPMNAIPFSPEIIEYYGVWHYQDGRIHATLEPVQAGLAWRILSWKAISADPGYLQEALDWLNAEGVRLVNQPGNERVYSMGVMREARDDQDYLLEKMDQSLTLINAAIEADYPQTPKDIARNRMQMYELLRAFSQGRLVSQAEGLEDTDELYDLMRADAPRYGAIVKAIFGFRGERSKVWAASVLRHAPGAGVVVTKPGTEQERHHLINLNTRQILNSDGVVSAEAVMHQIEYWELEPKSAKALLADIAPDASIMTEYGHIACLMYEIQKLEKASEMHSFPSV